MKRHRRQEGSASSSGPRRYRTARCRCANLPDHPASHSGPFDAAALSFFFFLKSRTWRKGTAVIVWLTRHALYILRENDKRPLEVGGIGGGEREGKRWTVHPVGKSFGLEHEQTCRYKEPSDTGAPS